MLIIFMSVTNIEINITKKQMNETKNKIKTYINELKPFIKSINKEHKKTMNELIEQLYWGMLAEAPQDTPNFMEIEKQLLEEHRQRLVNIAQNYKQEPIYVQMAYLKHMLSVLNNHYPESEMVVAIVNNLN